LLKDKRENGNIAFYFLTTDFETSTIHKIVYTGKKLCV